MARHDVGFLTLSLITQTNQVTALMSVSTQISWELLKQEVAM